MKKILMGIFGFILLLPFCVKAEILDSVENGNNSVDANVTVGDVEAPIYNVDISWDSLIYNWQYNSETNEYEWNVTTSKRCQLIERDVDYGSEESWEVNWEGSKDRIYTDCKCNTKMDENITFEEYKESNVDYYLLSESEYKDNAIRVEDYSIGTKIVPSVEWNSTADYSFVQGKFEYMHSIMSGCKPISEEQFEIYLRNLSNGWKSSQIYSDSSCNVKEDDITEYREGLYFEYQEDIDYIPLVGKEIPIDGRHYNKGTIFQPVYSSGTWYQVSLSLVNIQEPTQTPQTGDKIGTVTITIKSENN